MTGGLSYQETLRTVGTLLDGARADTAVIGLATDRAEAILPTWRHPRVWDRDALEAEVARQRGWRTRRPQARGLPCAGPMSRDLRSVGWLLDAQRVGPCTVAVAPDGIQVVRGSGQTHTFGRPPADGQRGRASHLEAGSFRASTADRP
jgi:hypothetical protein